MLCPPEEAHKSEFWNDWIAPQRLQEALFTVVLQERGKVGVLCTDRRVGQPSFDDQDIRLLEMLVTHMGGAVQLHLRIRDLEARQEAATEALNRWHLGVILLNHQGEVLLINRSATVILQQNDGLSLRGKELCAAIVNDTLALRKAVAGAAGTTCQPSLEIELGGALTISRPSGKRPLELLVTPACQNHLLVPERHVATIVFVSDPEQKEETDAEALRRLYGLSPTEAAVAALLAQGRNVNEACDQLHVSRDTAKTHLSIIFQKTGTRRQAELVRLLLRGPASLGSPHMVATPSLQKKVS